MKKEFTIKVDLQKIVDQKKIKSINNLSDFSNKMPNICLQVR